MQIPLIGGAYTDRSPALNAQTCINLFPVVSNQDAKTVLSLCGTPGLTALASSLYGASKCVRGFHAFEDYLYVVVNNTVYSVSTVGVVISLGTISTSSGTVYMADNGIQVVIVDGTSAGYYIQNNTLTAITGSTLTMGFTVGKVDPTGEIIQNTTGTATATVSSVDVDSGAFSTDDAVGTFTLTGWNGVNFTATDKVYTKGTTLTQSAVVSAASPSVTMAFEHGLNDPTGMIIVDASRVRSATVVSVSVSSGSFSAGTAAGTMTLTGYTGSPFLAGWRIFAVLPDTTLQFVGTVVTPHAVTIAFTSGSSNPQGKTIANAGQTATAFVTTATVTSGTFGGGNAAGTFTLSDWNEVAFGVGNVFIVVTDALTEIATVSTAIVAVSNFPAANSITFQDGYFIVTEADSGRIYISGLYDGTAWDPLDFATTEGRPDNVLRAISNTQDLWLFGESSVEVWYNPGSADFPFIRIPGALMDEGCIAGTPVKIKGQLYWLTNKGQVCRNTGYTTLQPVSTPEIEYQIHSYSTFADAIGSTFSVEGHHFFMLAFPTADRTLVFDTTTNFWHELRSTGSSLVTNGLVWTGATGSTPPTGWSRLNANVTYLIDTDVLKMTATTAANTLIDQAVTTVVGTTYIAKVKLKNYSYESGMTFSVGTTQYGTEYGTVTRSYTGDSEFTEYSFTFVATTTTTYFTVLGAATVANQYGWIAEAVLVSWGRHRSNCCEFFNKQWVCGDYTNGVVYYFDMEAYTDYIYFIRRQRAAQTINKERLNVIHHELEVEFEAGTGLIEGTSVVLDWSDTQGKTWSNQHFASLGITANYGARVRWRRLGASVDRVYRITVDDPIKVILLGAYARLEECAA